MATSQNLRNYLNGKFILVKVGNDNRPASADDIKDMEKKMYELFGKDQCDVLVTHHAVDIEIFGDFE